MDLRNYFNVKPKDKAGSAPAAPVKKAVAAPEKKRPASSRRKVVISDSEDEEPPVEVPAKVEEPVDPKDFFAKGKSKQSTAPATKPATTSATSESQTASTTTTTITTTTKAKPKAPTPEPARVEAKTKEAPVPAKRVKKSKDEDYFEDDSDEEIIPPPKARSAPAKTSANKAASAPTPTTKAAPAPTPKRLSVTSEPKKRKSAHQDSEDDDDYEDEDIKETKPSKKQKANPKAKKESDMDIDEQEVKVEKPKAKFNPWMLKNKAGPSALGSKEIPIGKENCLAGWAFVFTGELSSITREDAADLVRRYNGRVTGSPSGKTNFMVVGDDAGQSKLEKAKKLKIKTIDEDEFLDLIRTSPAKTEDGKVLPASAQTNVSVKASSSPTTASSSSASKAKKEVAAAASTRAASMPTSSTKDSGVVQTDLWTTKYHPKSLKDLCGNNAAINRLQKWLDAWYTNYGLNFKSDHPEKTGTFRAVLISGPPGIGKTSAAHLVAESLGYSVVEFNASDTRSKRSLDEQVRDLLDNQSLSGYFTSARKESGNGKAPAPNVNPSMAKKQVIIMDEVDGMAGGDRGGIAQLISFIKKTHVPIICICNDRQSPKVRSLVNSCFDMKFQRPQPNQVRARLMTILLREGRQVPSNVLDMLVSGTQSDIRQVLNMLSTWSLTKTSLDYDQGTALSKASEKFVALNVFQIAETLLQESNYRALSFADKFDVYFNDYQLAPLMIQENYVRMNPTDGRGDDLKTMELMSRAADSLSDSDLVDSMIHGTQQHWSLMPVHAAFSCVGPSFYVHGNARPTGNYGPLLQFPSYLGKWSSANKYARLMKEVQIRMRLKISADKNEVRQSYLPALFPALTRPLLKDGADGIDEVIELMDKYYLSKEDWDTILELGVCRNNGKDVLDKIPSNVKSAFTRKYNSEAHPQPFLKPTLATKGRGSASVGPAGEEPDNLDVVEADAPVPEEEPEEDAEAESIDKDKNIKQKKARGGATAKAKGKGKASSSKSKR
ncbi:hypothetical protein BGZ94_008791 [Podila epigama]|nr:hypothetical protein BGZ94_008791 [Podila epigama]